MKMRLCSFFRPVLFQNEMSRNSCSPILNRNNAFISSRCLSGSMPLPNEMKKDVPMKGAVHKATINKAMRAYLQRSVEHEKFIVDKVAEYEIGKRHLANMMGENPETFTQEDIDNALTYLMPSGLFEPRARPVMKHPAEIFPKRKVAAFDDNGRPFHCLFYTGRPAYYSLCQEISIKAREMDDIIAKMKGQVPKSEVTFEGSKWITKDELEQIILEPVSDSLFEHFIISLERLMAHPLYFREKDFIMKFRKKIATDETKENIPPLMYTEGGVPFMTFEGRRKLAKATVTVLGQGSGKVRVNGDDILYFENIQEREQIMFPLQLSGLLRSMDVEAKVEGGGKSGQAGAMRYAIAMALRSFLPENLIERLRVAGLLTRDARKRERKKPGQRRARAKFTWKKR